MLHTGGGWGDSPPYYVKRFEYPEKRYINVTNLIIIFPKAEIQPVIKIYFCNEKYNEMSLLSS